MKTIFNITLFLFCFLSLIKAQTIGGSFMVGSPQGDFRTNVDRLGYGLQIQGTLWSPSKERPFTFGLNLGYMIYGEENEGREWSYTIPDVTVEVSRTNSLANIHLLLQISPFNGTVKPYLEGLVGGSYIFTTSEVKSENNLRQIAESTNYDDFNWSYGGGAGLLLQISKNLGDVKYLYLDLKTRYTYGTEAQYLTEKDIRIEDGKVFYNLRRSKTDLLTFHLGVIAYF